MFGLQGRYGHTSAHLNGVSIPSGPVPPFDRNIFATESEIRKGDVVAELAAGYTVG